MQQVHAHVSTVPHRSWRLSLRSDAEVALERIADLAGHATTAMTEGVYRHQVAESVSGGKAAMEQMFG